jgi:hypothetical protein
LSYEKGYKDLLNVRLARLGEMAKTKSRSELLQQYWLKGPGITSGGAFNPTPENGANVVYCRNALPVSTSSTIPISASRRPTIFPARRATRNRPQAR